MSISTVHGSVSSGGRPLEGVVCSDGRSVVCTDGDGTFSIEPRGPFVLVCVPTGYATERWYLPVAADLRFELEPVGSSVPFSFAQITDLHLSLGEWPFGAAVASTPASVTKLLEEIADTRPDVAFVVCTGDQTNNGMDEEFEAYIDAVTRSPLRVIPIPGNHDHNSVDPEGALADGARYGPGVAYTNYDKHLGPRWFSFDHAGLHFVAIDWTTRHLGLEVDVQDEWVRADLAHVTDGTPVIFLTHDLMPSEWFASVGTRPVASFSGHWHTTRVVDLDGALHVNTAPATFGGLDYSPAHWRVATWDGTAMSIETATRRFAPIARASASCLWKTKLAYGAQRAAPVIADDLVLATSGSENRSSGALEGFDAVSGERQWRVELSSAVKTAPLVCGARAIATSVTGETVCVNIRTGAELWRTEIDDRLRLWVYLRPTSDGRLVFVGDTARFCAIDLTTGEIVWSRDDLGVRGNITCNAHPIVVDGMLVVAFSAQVPDLWVLDAATGASIRPTDVRAANVYEIDADERVRHLLRGPSSGFARDPDAPDAYVVRLGNVVERFTVRNGTTRWTARIAGWFNPAAPVIDGNDVFLSQADGTVLCLARDDGAVRWSTSITDSSPVAMTPYRADGGALLGEPLVDGDRVVAGCGDGRVVVLDRDDGRIAGEWRLGAPIAAAVATARNRYLVVTADGVLRALSRESSRSQRI